LKGRVASIKFSVSYTLREYRSFVREYTPMGVAKEFAKRGKAPGKTLHAFVCAMSLAVATIMFFFKKRRMPVCDFEIDAEGITRTSATGRHVVPWSKVVAVHSLSPGYLVVTGKGAMPLPYRCLLPADAAMLAALIEKRRSGFQSIADMPA
jgi:hypothetical protein